MKRKNIIAILLSSFVWLSCESYLDKAPNMGLTEADVFNDYNSCRGYLDNCYGYIYDFSKWNAGGGNGADNNGLSRSHIGQLSDEGANAFVLASNASMLTLNKGLWYDKNLAEVGWFASSGGGLTVIPAALKALRISSRIIDKVPTMDRLSTEQKAELTGQAHFFRGWFFFEIIRRAGGMPNFMQYFSPDDNLDLPRMSYGESSDLIIGELNLAIQQLPDEWDLIQTGRVTKASAYALRSMVQLYAASPLMQNPIDRIDQYTDYNLERAKSAAQYAQECLQYIESVVPSHQMMSGSQYKNIFYHSPNFVSDESLFYINSTGQNRDNSFDLPVFWQNFRFSNRAQSHGQSVVSPTQNMVDMYETKNGYPVRLVGNRFETNDPDWTEEDKLHHPFDKRDPRLTNNFILPGERFGTIGTTPNYLATWEGGVDIATASNQQVICRYLCKKWQWPEGIHDGLGVGSKKQGYALNYYNCIIIRTTQVWLDYAEAMNEAYGPTANPMGYAQGSALDAINRVRSRVGQSNVRPEFTASKELFRERIRNERGVELLFENHRWHDIRRWMIAEQLFGITNPIKGVRVTASNATASAPKTGNIFSYELIDIPTEVRVFQRRQYWYPLPKDEVNRLYNFKQNPGW